MIKHNIKSALKKKKNRTKGSYECSVIIDLVKSTTPTQNIGHINPPYYHFIFFIKKT